LNRQDAKEQSKAQNTKRTDRRGDLMRDLWFLNDVWRLGGSIVVLDSPCGYCPILLRSNPTP